MSGRDGAKPTRCKIETTDARSRNIHMREGVSRDQCIVPTELIVGPWANCPAALRNAKHFCKGIDDVERGWVECCAINDSAVVDRISAEIEEERTLLVEWTTHISTVF